MGIIFISEIEHKQMELTIKLIRNTLSKQSEPWILDQKNDDISSDIEVVFFVYYLSI